MITAILFVLMMLVLIAPHELGHFIAAKRVGVRVNEFSIGMGPLIWQTQKGETKYSLRLIPIGGYNAMEGEDEASDDPRGFSKQNAPSKLRILFAGVAMNVIIAIIVCIISVQISGIPVNKIAEVAANKPAAEAGLMVGDKIVAIDGVKTSTWEEVTTCLEKYDPDKGSDIAVTAEREGKRVDISMIPKYDEETERYVVGITADVSRNPLLCIGSGVKLTWNLNKLMLQSFGMLFKGEVGADDVSGPVGLVRIVNQTKEQGAQSYLLLLALVSLNLALVNLLPIPALDGGKILFVLLKLISRGRITDEMEFKATAVGFALLMLLFVFITANDIKNLFN